jgi:hypothetical protein
MRWPGGMSVGGGDGGGKVEWMEGESSKIRVQTKPLEGSNSTLAYPGLG